MCVVGAPRGLLSAQQLSSLLQKGASVGRGLVKEAPREGEDLFLPPSPLPLTHCPGNGAGWQLGSREVEP